MNEVIFNALCSCLGLSPSSEQALALIRQAYTEPENNPQPARTIDVIYWSLAPEDADDPASYGTEQGDGPARSANAEPQDCPRRSCNRAGYGHE